MINDEKSVVVCFCGNWIPKEVKNDQIGQHLNDIIQSYIPNIESVLNKT